MGTGTEGWDPYLDVPLPDEPDSEPDLGWDRFSDNPPSEPEGVVLPFRRGKQSLKVESASACSEFTDSEVSERLVEQALDDRWLFTDALGWLRWTGVVWAPQPDEALIEVVREWVNGEVARVAAAGDWGRTSKAAALQAATRIRRIAELARGQRLADAAQFDQDPDILVCGNGVVDLRTGELQPHDPERLVTKSTPIDYRPGATHPDWHAALEALPMGVREWAQMRFGQAATGHQPDDDRMVIVHGGGENGKSTLLVGIQRALGAYAVLVPDQLLLGTSESHPADLMTLRGARFALIEETPEGRRLNVSRLKKVIGTPEITARLMRQNFTTFRATHALFLSTNYTLTVDETDHGTWRRLARMVCPYKFVKPGEPLTGGRDRHGEPGLKSRLGSGRAQAEAALAWILAGTLRWYAEDRIMPPLPDRVAADTAAWRESSDSVLAYAAERLEPDANSRIWTADLLADFNEFLTALGQREWSDRTLAERFGSHAWAGDRRIEKQRGRHPGTVLSRAHHRRAMGIIPDVHPAWVGVRFTPP